MRRDPELPATLHEVSGVVQLVGAERAPTSGPARSPLHPQPAIPLAGPGGSRQLDVHDHPVPVLHQDVACQAEPGPPVHLPPSSLGAAPPSRCGPPARVPSRPAPRRAPRCRRRPPPSMPSPASAGRPHGPARPGPARSPVDLRLQRTMHSTCVPSFDGLPVIVVLVKPEGTPCSSPRRRSTTSGYIP